MKRGRRAGQVALRMWIFLCILYIFPFAFSLSFFLCHTFLLTNLGEKGREAPLGRHGSQRSAANDARRGWGRVKTRKTTTARRPRAAAELLPWPFGPHVAG